MRFAWQEQQEMLRSMLDRYAAERHGMAATGNWQDTLSRQKTAWKELAELGVLAIPFSEADGGIDGTALDTLIAMEAFGKGLVRLPYISSIILAGGLLRLTGSADQKQQYIGPLTVGDILLALAFAEPHSRYNPASVSTTARRVGDGFVLNGRKSAVLGAAAADACFVTARTAGGDRDESGISLFLVPLELIECRNYGLIDGMTASEMTLNDVHVPAHMQFGELDHALPAVERVLDEATAAICADAVGAMEALNQKCVEFAKTRNAFGQPIANFQAIQHRLVDMQVSYEMAAAMALKAASQLADGVETASRTISACKMQVNEEAAFIGKTAVQLHGAIGITEELDIGHYFKRLTAMQLSFGSSDYHMRRCVRLDAANESRSARNGY